MGDPIKKIMGEIANYQQSIKPESQSIKQQQALYPDFKFGPERPGPDYTVSSTGVKKGDQVTKTVPVKVTQGATGGKQTTDQDKYMADLAKRFPGASGEELAKKIPGSKGSYISSSMIDTYNKKYYKPKTVTTGTPDQEVTVTATIPRDADQSNENDGSSASDTKPDTIEKDTETPDGKAGPMPNLLGGGNGQYTQDFKPSIANKNPSVTSKGTGKDVHHELSLNNQAVNKA